MLNITLSLAPTMNSVPAIYRKLEREAYRAWHAENRIHKADHFFNFCVTAHSLRDFYLEHIELPAGPERGTLQEKWSADPLLKAVAEIANTTKHFYLRSRKSGKVKRPATKSVTLKKSQVAEVYLNAKGEPFVILAKRNDVSVTLSDGERFDLYLFMKNVKGYWRSFFAKNGIRLRKQSIAQLRGVDA